MDDDAREAARYRKALEEIAQANDRGSCAWCGETWGDGCVSGCPAGIAKNALIATEIARRALEGDDE